MIFEIFLACLANDPQIFLDGPDPGLVPDGAETRGTVDVEWAGAVAKGATIKLVVSRTNEFDSAERTLRHFTQLKIISHPL